MKKGFITSTAIIVLLGLIFTSYVLVFSTESLRGTVVNIEITDDYLVFTVKEELSGQHADVFADEHTNTSYCHLEGDIYLGDIKIGDTIEAIQKKYFCKDGYAESIVVQLHRDDTIS